MNEFRKLIETINGMEQKVVLSTNDLRFDKIKKHLIGSMQTLGLERFPRVIEVVSSYTGKKIIFVQDDEAAIQNEFWDGEIMEYIPYDNLIPNVSKLILSWS